MPFTLRLSITGLHAIVARRASESGSSDLASIDLIAPSSCHGTPHVPSLVFQANKVQDGDRGPLDRSRLFVTPSGEKFTALDIAGKAVRFEPEFAMGHEPGSIRAAWGEDAERPADQASEAQLNWVPSAPGLGIESIPVPEDLGKLPEGAHARLNLQGGGRLYASKIVRDNDRTPILWEFPAGGYRRAIADEVVFELGGLQSVFLHLSADEWVRVVDLEEDGSVGMAYSHDVARVADDQLTFGDFKDSTLEHMGMLGQVASGQLQLPRPTGLVGTVRTAYPICPSALLMI